MDEKEIERKTTEESKTEETATAVESSDNRKPGLISEAEQTAARIEKANEETKRLLDKQERLIAESRLEGKSLAGYKQPKKEQTPEEFANDLMEGKITKPLLE